MYKLKYLKKSALILILLCSTISYGQDEKYAIGLSGGPSLINMYGKLSSYWYSIDNGSAGTLYTWPWVGGSAEFSFQYKINKTFSIQTALSYQREGFMYEGSMSGMGRQHINLDYATIPVLARAEIGRKIKFTVCAGPYISALLDVWGPIGFGMDAGLQVGFGMIVPISKRFEFSLENRNTIGLYGVKYIFDPFTPALRNIDIGLMAGISYKFGKKKVKA